MFNELSEIRALLVIYNIVENEWNIREQNNSITYSAIRDLLYGSFSYKIIMGLSKIFIGKKEYSLEKTINVISQHEMYKKIPQVKIAIENIRDFLEHSEMVKIIATYRDDFFAHLDKICVMSDIRIYPNSAIKNIKMCDIDMGINLIRDLYKECFGIYLKDIPYNLDSDDIIKTFFWM